MPARPALNERCLVSIFTLDRINVNAPTHNLRQRALLSREVATTQGAGRRGVRKGQYF